ncbi:MAG: D-alanine--D-alanine ligase [Candidatus Aminicenantes bacterium]|nr:D-alanine--D-alanine ligase [Candidatus Aminicenantes bacterium]
MDKKIKVVLFFGGRSAEHEVSCQSAAAVYKNLNQNKFEPSTIYINKAGKWTIVSSPLQPSNELNQKQFYSFMPWAEKDSPQLPEGDIYFPVLHGPFGEDGTIQGFLEMADVPFVGAGVMGSAAGMDKEFSKILFQAHGLRVAKFLIIKEWDWEEKKTEVLSEIAGSFDPPFFVKPANMGSSVGITKVNNRESTETAVDNAFKYDRKILVEEAIFGREFECSVLGNEHPEASLPGEVIPFREFYDYRDKYVEGKTDFVIPAEIAPDLVSKIQRLSLEAFKAAECSGLARVDFFLQSSTQNLFINEINTLPGFTEISMYPKLWEVSGLPYPELLERLIELGFERHKKKKRKVEHEDIVY